MINGNFLHLLLALKGTVNGYTVSGNTDVRQQVSVA